jgi:hypothetical protein
MPRSRWAGAAGRLSEKSSRALPDRNIPANPRLNNTRAPALMSLTTLGRCSLTGSAPAPHRSLIADQGPHTAAFRRSVRVAGEEFPHVLRNSVGAGGILLSGLTAAICRSSDVRNFLTSFGSAWARSSILLSSLTTWRSANRMQSARP